MRRLAKPRRAQLQPKRQAAKSSRDPRGSKAAAQLAVDRADPELPRIPLVTAPFGISEDRPWSPRLRRGAHVGLRAEGRTQSRSRQPTTASSRDHGDDYPDVRRLQPNLDSFFGTQKARALAKGYWKRHGIEAAERTCAHDTGHHEDAARRCELHGRDRGPDRRFAAHVVRWWPTISTGAKLVPAPGAWAGPGRALGARELRKSRGPRRSRPGRDFCGSGPAPQGGSLHNY